MDQTWEKFSPKMTHPLGLLRNKRIENGLLVARQVHQLKLYSCTAMYYFREAKKAPYIDLNVPNNM